MGILSKADSIIFDGINIAKYNLCLGEINGNSGVTTTSNTGAFNVVQEKTGSSDVFNIISEEFTDCIKFTLQLFDIHGKEFTQQQIELFNRMFFRKDSTYRKLQFIDLTYSNIYYLAKCDKFSRIAIGGKTIGFELSFITNSPHSYSIQGINIEFDATNGLERIIMDNNSLVGESHPDLDITFTSEGSFVLANELTGKTMKLENCVAGERITLNGYTKEFVSSVRSAAKLFNDFNFTWFTIGNTFKDKKNKLTYSGTANCRIKITYTPNRLMGV